MDSVKKVLALIESLKELGYNRRMIEEVLGYVPNSIDQSISRGPTGKLIASLTLLLKYAILEKGNSVQQNTGALKHHLAEIQANLDALKGMLIAEPRISDSVTELGDDDHVEGESTKGKLRTSGKRGMNP